MSSAVERFRARKQIQAAPSKGRLKLLPPAAAVAALNAESVDEDFVNAPEVADSLKFQPSVSDEEVQKLLKDLSTKFEDQKFDAMIAGMKTTILQNIAGPFGLGKVVAAYDKTGGNVDTVNNVRQGIYATEKEAQRYAKRGKYDPTPSHAHPDYIAANRAMQRDFENGTLPDAYTGEILKQAMVNDDQLKASLDHVVSAKEVHDDPGRVLAGLDAAALANKAENLAPTAKTINSGKGARTPEQWLADLKADAPLRRAQIAELENKVELTIPEKKRLTKLRAQEQVQADLVQAKAEEARKAIDSDINRSYYTSGKFVGGLAVSGAKEGAKAGIQQALGEVLVELFAAIFDELSDLYRSGRSEDSILKELAVRCKKIKTRLLAKWKKVLAAFKDGFLAGLLSSLLTTLINTFVTTGQRLVRIIRQGFMSLLSAIKMLLFPPKGMTRLQALHESSKLVVSAGVVVGGIALEEVVSKQLSLVPGMALIADATTGAIVGSATAILTTFACYLLDKADFFNVNKEARESAIGAMLDERRSEHLKDLEKARIALLAYQS